MGCSTRLLKYLANCCEGAGVEAELDDAGNVLCVDLYHVGLDAVCGLA